MKTTLNFLFSTAALSAVASAVNVTDSSGVVLAGEDSQYAPLCGTAPQYFPPPSAGGFLDLTMEPCCSLADTKPINPDQIVNPEGNSERYIGTSEAIITPWNDEECNMDAVISMNIAFKKSSLGYGGCCQTCTCYGDPNCISFDGTADIWILCDGRTAPNTPGDRCVIRKNTCEQQKDFKNNQCVWNGPDYDDPKQQAKAEDNWSVPKKGSACVPNPDSGESWFRMYSADSFDIQIMQAERGIIEAVNITTSKGLYHMNVFKCFEKDQPWEILNAESQELPDWFVRSTRDKSPEIFWRVTDPETGIFVGIRCTGNQVGGHGNELTVKRLNVEEVAEPEPDYKTKRTNVDGFCATDKMPKEGTWEYTEKLIDENTCEGNRNSDDQVKMAVARAICDNDAVPLVGINECMHTFCENFYMPYYKNVEQCYKAVNPSKFNKKKIAQGFCRAVANFDFDICVALIMENDNIPGEGFELAYSTYVKGYMPDDKQCIKPDEWYKLPVDLDDCQSGFILQYYDEKSGKWINFRAFPENQPICRESESSFSTIQFFCGDKGNKESKELFKNRIRYIQKHADRCETNICTPTDGSTIYIEYNGQTPAPTLPNQPTPLPTLPFDQPTPLPTPLPTTPSPTPESPQPTPQPTTPSPTPETPQPTSPTPQPTSPTPQPTSPTPQPTSPTPQPTSPTPEPTTPEPTPEPTTPEPTPEPTTPEPTPEPTTPEPTPEPTTPEPTAAPTSNPTCPPLWPGQGLEIDFANSQFQSNNLESGTMVFKNVGKNFETDLTLVISQAGDSQDYKQPGNTLNEIKGEYLVIYLECGKSLELMFTLETDDEKVVQVAQVDLSFIDLFKSKSKACVKATSSRNIYIDDDSTLDQNKKEVCATENGEIDEQPNSPTQLSSAEKQNSFTARWYGVQKMPVTLSLQGNCPPEGYRAFYIAGTSSLADCMSEYQP